MSLQQVESQQKPLHICITGSSQGIGLAAAKRLVQEGHVVYHACRNEQRAALAVKEAGGGVPMVCELNDFHSIRAFCQTLKQQAPRLDVLCLNAGISPSTQATTPELTRQGFEACIGINHLGHFLVAQLLYPKLAANPDGGRIVITSSSVHDPAGPGGKSGGQGATLGDLSGLGMDLRRQEKESKKERKGLPTMVDGSHEYSGGKVYKDSKLCNILTCRTASHLFPPNITSVSFNPGLVTSTGLFSSWKHESPMKFHVMTWVASVLRISVPVEVAGDRLVYLVTATADVIPNGSYYTAPTKSFGTTPEDGFIASPVSQEASDPDLAQRLWDKSLEIVKDWL